MNEQCATAHLTATANSHDFVERKIPLVRNAEPTKIGRAVAKLRALSNNAIFDCKVLSRNHAVIWYEDDKFYLKDTKSSNGTYVNNERLSKGGEESPPREIFSGDIVQLGVDIIESQKKATFNCIIAILKLHHPDGREVNRPDNDAECHSEGSVQAQIVANIPPGGQYVSPAQMFQLMQYLREANHKKEMLQEKFANLEKLVEDAQNKTNDAFRSCITEDQLLSRIENLETQLDYYKKNVPADRMRNDLERMLEEKDVYENKCKKHVQNAVTEKNEAMRQQSDLEQLLQTSELRNKHLEEDLTALRQHCNRLDELNAQLDKEKRSLVESSQGITNENAELKIRIDAIEEEKMKIVTDFETMKAAMTPQRLQYLATEYAKCEGAPPSDPTVGGVDTPELAVASVASLGADIPTSSKMLDDASPTEELVRLEKALQASKVEARSTANVLEQTRDELKELKETLTTSGVEKDELTSRTKRAESLLAEKCRQLESVNQQNQSEKEQRAQLQDQITKLQDELAIAWRKIDSSTEDSRILRDQVHSLTQKVEIQARATPPRGLVNQETIDDELEKAIADNARFKADLSAIADAKQTLEKEKADIEVELIRLRDESTKARNELRRANDTLVDLQKQLDEHQATSTAGADELRKHQIECENLRNKVESLSAELNKAKERQASVECQLFDVQTRQEANMEGAGFWQATQQLRDMANWDRIFPTFWSSAIPLSILLLSIVMAFRPFLASMTATVETATDPDQVDGTPAE